MIQLIARVRRGNEFASEPDLLIVSLDDRLLDKMRCRSEMAVANRILDPDFEGSRYDCRGVDMSLISLTENLTTDCLGQDDWVVVAVELELPYEPWEEDEEGESVSWSMFHNDAGWLTFSGFGDSSGDLYEAPNYSDGISVKRLIEAYYACAEAP